MRATIRDIITNRSWISSMR